jgi:putative ABC transport system ATP-binding protein
MIKVNHLCKQYPKASSPVFNDLSFSLDAGQSMALCGQSGSGKSTLIGLLCGLDTPTSGEIILKDTLFHNLSLTQKSEFRAQYMSLVFQQVTLIPYLDVNENITLPALYTKKNIASSDIDYYLNQMELTSVKNKFPHELSIGQAQRICLIRTLVSKPKIILADEPTGALDPPNAAFIFSLLTEYCKKNKAAVLIATHDWSLAKQCDHQLWLSPKVGQ